MLSKYLVAIAVCVLTAEASSQSLELATHDWTGLNVAEPDTWADVKTPGDGRTYSVGTTNTSSPASNTPFSNQIPAYWPGAAFFSSTKRVAIIQIAEPNQPDGIRAQAYFSGNGSPLTGAVGASTFARAISVWPAENLSDMRIAICGSTRETTTPLSPTPPNLSFTGASGSPAHGGFIAVYDGNLNFQWSRHFFEDHLNASTTITDVSIRVEQEIRGGQLVDVEYVSV